MIRQLVTGVAVLGVVSALSVAPAQAAAYSVTLKTDDTKVDITKTFRLSGKVSGTGAGSKSLIIQRKIGSGAWTNYSSVSTRPTGTYSKTLTMPSVGAKSFRVLAPKSAKLTTGTSNVVGVTGYTWLKLVDQPTTADGSVVNVTRTVQGTTYPKSVLVVEQYSAVWNLDGKCDVFTTGVTVDPTAGPDAADVPVKADTIEKGVVKSAVAKAGSYTPFTGSVTGVTGFAVTASESDSAPFDLLTPKVRCATTTLPEYHEGGGSPDVS